MATAVGISGEEVLQLGEKLQENFLRQHADDPEMDPRDISRVQESLPFVCKFIRHNHGNFNNAFNHMVECLKWRKSFGINDVCYEHIDENLWKSELAYDHGEDRQGNDIVILNIRLHRKNSKKALMIQKWVAFSFEVLQRFYPDKKLCMIFNMSGAGLSNMDMELVRFIINCFKVYFPELLATLLVYNMPWVLQAAWRIVQTWLSEGARSKVKFVCEEDIQEYIAPDNLLKMFGGNDPWQFVYEVEKEKYFRRAAEIWGEERARAALKSGDPSALLSSDGRSSVDGGGGEIEEEEESRKQVRFSANLPPPRQTRFGDDDDDELPRTHNPENRLLLGRSTSNSQIRRRQVNRLMHLQSGVKGEGEMNGGPFWGRRYSEPPRLARNYHLLISPDELIFTGMKDSDILCTLTLTNITEDTIAYKIKTTAPTRYKVRPNLALIDPKSVAKVDILLIPGTNHANVGSSITQDKFLVQSHAFDSTMTLPSLAQLPAYWKALPESSIKERRMKCRWVNHLPKPPPSATPSEATSTPKDPKPLASCTAHTAPERSAPRESHSSHSSHSKIDRLLASNAELNKKIVKLQRLNYVILLMLVLVVIKMFFF